MGIAEAIRIFTATLGHLWKIRKRIREEEKSRSEEPQNKDSRNEDGQRMGQSTAFIGKWRRRSVDTP
jgi:hypothetical protein